MKTANSKITALKTLLTVILALSCCANLAAQNQGWPRTITKPGGTVVLYQPQVDDWSFQTVKARMAFSLTPTGGKQHVGVVSVQMHTETDIDTHTVVLSNPQIDNIYFPSLDAATASQMDQLMRTSLNPSATMTISLDKLVASAKKTKAPPVVAGVKDDPPAIFVSMKPAILLMVNGPATTAPIEHSNIEFVINANWPLFNEKGKTTYYLFDGKGWMTANGLNGPWTATAKLPKDMSKVPLNSNFTSLKGFIPPPPGSNATFPMVYFSDGPAEVVIFGGQPQWSLIPGTQLSYATNTESTVFKYNPTGAYYYLTSGRWFTTTKPLAGPWTFASYELPEDFKNIPLSSPAGKVLASVPGTPEAEDAVLIAQVPTTATVTPAAAKEVQVSYAGGQPQFQPIEGTSMMYAANTPNRVIQVGNEYYLCYQGVWFVSFSALGPWQLAQTVPQVIYTIPPSSPVYNVTYVTQVAVSDGSVNASYTAGYTGAFIMGAAVGAIVCSGTGWYYPPYIYGGFYYPYAYTYGYHTYNPYTGAYGYRGAAYGPYGSAHWGASYNPNTGTYARGATASTAYGSRTVAQAYNPYTGAYGATRQGSNAYGSWGQSVVSKNGNTAYSQHVSNAYGTAGSVQTSKGGEAAGVSTAHGNTAAGKTASGDMYAGHDGNVYKNTGDGWQKYDNGTWNNVQKPATTSSPSSLSSTDQQKAQSYKSGGSGSTPYNKPSGGYDKSGGGSYGDLNQEAQNRQRGAEQTQRFSQSQHSGWGGGGGDRWGGGGDRWGGGGFNRGGGGFRR